MPCLSLLIIVLLVVPIEGSEYQFSYLFAGHSPHSRPEEFATYIALSPGGRWAVGLIIFVYTIVFLFDQALSAFLASCARGPPL
jgi:hypothetical protein